MSGGCFDGLNLTGSYATDAKRLIGRCFSDGSVRRDLKLSPFKVVHGSSQRPRILAKYKGEEKLFAPEEISSMVLTKMRQIAEAYLGSPVKNAVITVPAFFTTVQRQATMDAGVIAGLNVIGIINEPAAAAMAYAFNRNVGREGRKTTLVFGLGGGTLNVSLLAIEKGTLRVMTTAGDTHLGGEDFDDRMVDHFVQKFKTRHGRDVCDSSRALRRLRTSCEKAKRELSLTKEATIDIECLHDGIDFCSTITRDEFETLNNDLFSKCIAVVDKCLADAQMKKSCVDDVLLVGGSTRIPKVQQLLTKHFGKELCKAINADQATAYGAALQAAILTRKGKKDVPSLLLQDVTPLPLIVTMNEREHHLMVSMNAAIPIKREQRFRSPYEDETLTVTVHEGPAIIGCLLEHRRLSGKAGPCLDPNLCVDIDVNGILSVWLHHNNAERKITIPIQRLSGEEIEKMTRNAELYDLHEKDHGEKMKAKNSLEKYFYTVKNAIGDKKFETALRKKIEDATEQVFRLLARDQPAEVNEYNEKEAELRGLFKIHEETQQLGRNGCSLDPDCKSDSGNVAISSVESESGSPVSIGGGETGLKAEMEGPLLSDDAFSKPKLKSHGEDSIIGVMSKTKFDGQTEALGHKISPSTKKPAKANSMAEKVAKTLQKVAVKSFPCSSSSSVVEGAISKIQVDPRLEDDASPSNGDDAKSAASEASDRVEDGGPFAYAGPTLNRKVNNDHSIVGDAGFVRRNGGGSDSGEVMKTSLRERSVF
ncbi:hypothetical protein EJ110_NYTH05578 [Nymphaea thermarum]|nr:hypothetical protein EJ110_NYTH05578 [Nymphaea thermarum]